MQSESQRRNHDGEFKAQVMADCQAPSASVVAVSLDHGLNVNLARKRLVGRGIKRRGLGTRARRRGPTSGPGRAATTIQAREWTASAAWAVRGSQYPVGFLAGNGPP